jgi:hypothetical protein
MIDTFKASIDRFAGMLRQVNIACIDEDDPRYVVYSVRVPSPRLDDAALIALGRDDELGADLAAWLATRAKNRT